MKIRLPASQFVKMGVELLNAGILQIILPIRGRECLPADEAPRPSGQNMNPAAAQAARKKSD